MTTADPTEILDDTTSWRPTAVLARTFDITQGQAATAIVAVAIAAVLTLAGLPPVLRNRNAGGEAAPAATTTPAPSSAAATPEPAGDAPVALAAPVLAGGGYVLSSRDTATPSFADTATPAPTTASISSPATGEASRFAAVGSPGAPDGLAVGADGIVYVATDNGTTQGEAGPSKIFALDTSGTVTRTFTITGQPDGHERGLTGLALDGGGGLIALDAATGTVLRIDLARGAQSTLAELVDLPACGLVIAAPSGCEPGVEDEKPLPRGAAFDHDGNLFVTDASQGVLWRITAGTGKAEPWLTANSFGGGNGVAGVAVEAAGSILVAAPQALDPAAALGGAVYRITVNDDGSPGAPALVVSFPVGEEPAGVAALTDGSFVVALRGADAVALIGTDGTETRRVAGSGDATLDTPSGVAFAGDTLLVTNQAPATKEAWAVMAVGIR